MGVTNMKKISTEKLGDLIKKKRKENSISQEELGNLTGINRQVIGRIEACQLIPSIAQLESILTQLQINFDDIILEEDSEKDVLVAMRGSAQSDQETEALDKMISMMLCLKKHDIIRRKLNG
jgi:transcriptional regulator with XRE-family HTH domain